MTKADLVDAVAARTPGRSRKDAEAMVGIILDRMAEALAAGDKIEIRGFGVFRVRARRARSGRNPKTGAAVSVPERRAAVFKPGKELAGLLEKGS